MADYDVTTAGSAIEFDTVLAQFNSAVKIDETHFINFWSGNGSDGFAQVFAVSTSTWAVTTAAASLEFDTTYAGNIQSVAIDSNHFLVSRTNTSSYCVAQVFAVSTSTWAVTTMAAELTVSTAYGADQSLVAIDSNHFLLLRRTGPTDVLAVNTSTWAVTTAASTVDVTAVDARTPVLAQLDDTHFLAIYADAANNGYAQVLAVSTSTWAVTTTATELGYISSSGMQGIVVKIDEGHCAVFSHDNSLYTGYAQVLAVNTSTWAVTTTATPLKFVADFGYGIPQSAKLIDENHVLLVFVGPSSDGYAQVFTVNTSTWAVTTAAASLEFDAVNLSHASTVKIDTSHFACTWSGSGNDGYAQVITVALPAAGPSFLSAWARNSNAVLKVM